MFPPPWGGFMGGWPGGRCDGFGDWGEEPPGGCAVGPGVSGKTSLSFCLSVANSSCRLFSLASASATNRWLTPKLFT